MTPIISVVIPVFNSATHIDEAYESVINQSFVDFECIFIYSESEDDTLEKLKNFATSDQRVKIITSKKMGISEALNLGVDSAKGIYVARMDADDICEHNRFQEQFDLLEHTKADLCGCSFEVINDIGKFLFIHTVPTSASNIRLYTCVGTPFAHPSVMFRRSTFIENNFRYGIGKYNLVEDYDLWARMLSVDGIVAVNSNLSLLKYRLHEKSISTNKKISIILQSHAISRDYFLANWNKLENDFYSEKLNDRDYDAMITYSLYSIIYNFKFHFWFRALLTMPINQLILYHIKFFIRKIKYIYSKLKTKAF